MPSAASQNLHLLPLPSEAVTKATDAATYIKDRDVYIVSLFINDLNMPNALDFMRAISSEGEVTYAQGFNALDGLVETMKSEVFPC